MTCYAKQGLVFLFLALSFAQFSYSQPVTTSSGFYYPVQPLDGYYLGYHRIGGLVSGTSGYGGHFMSPSSQRIDQQTGKPGLYFFDDYHNGMDVMARYGTPVYTISSGIVKQISTGGWTKSGTTNVGVVIAHFTNTGQEFWAVYGHIEASTLNSQIKINAQVPAGMQIGKVGTWANGNHLHFGVHFGNTALPYKAASSAADSYGYGMIGINYWQGTWPNRMDWMDPVFFIEANCPLSALNNCPTGDLVAKSDMKQYMVGRVNPNLIAYDPNFGFNSQDQNFEYRYQWLYASEGSRNHWFLVNHATYIPNRKIRYVRYEDSNTQQVYGWYQVLVIP